MSTSSKKYVVIAAGGIGKRMDAEVPKQFILLNNTPILIHTINSFINFSNEIELIVVLPGDQIPEWKDICKKYNFNIKHEVVKGGKTRFDSVKNALEVVNDEGLIAIHDGVRPFVSQSTIKKCFKTAEKLGNAVPCITPADSIRLVEEGQNKPVDRTLINMIQTPQVFSSQLIKKAYEQSFSPEFTDDASVVEKLGVKINLVDGNRENIKITTSFDLSIAEAIMKGL